MSQITHPANRINLKYIQKRMKSDTCWSIWKAYFKNGQLINYIVFKQSLYTLRAVPPCMLHKDYFTTVTFHNLTGYFITIVMCLIELLITQQVHVLLSALKSPPPSLPSTTDGEWETSYFRGSWVEGSTAGGSRNFLSHWQNPCFPFTLCDEPAVTSGVNVSVTLHQSRPNTDLHPIGFHIYKVSQTLREITRVI